MKSNKIIGKLLAERHSLWLSVGLHLFPGVLIVAVYFLVAPLIHNLGIPPFLGWIVAMCIALVPTELGLILWLGKQRNGKFSMEGIVHFLDKPTSNKKNVLFIIPLIIWFLTISVALLPLDKLIYKAFFEWVPFEGAGGNLDSVLIGYSHKAKIISLAVCIPLSGLLLPVVEELYFRGFLMPRIPISGLRKPILSSIFFSIYHFWTPWGVISRVVYLLPTFIFVWIKKDLRISIYVHAGTNFIMQTIGTLALIFNFI